MEKVKTVTGKWINELGSTMELTENEKGQISGTYTTAVEFKSNIEEETADLVGYTNTHQGEGAETITITFCMAWKKEGSCSGFTGQIYQDIQGDVIKTKWLLHSPMQSLGENWEATRVGENTFRRKSGK